ncbi:MAG: hypothetical protein IKO51_05330 [Clostridia bacterium]|nr:hypothetical protein [Clostridia bacterium]
MSIRRGLMAQMAGSTKRLPLNWDIVEFTPTQDVNIITIQHSLGSAPDMAIIIPEEYTGANAQTNSTMLFGAPTGNVTGNANYPKRFVNNYLNSSNNWDYTANAILGWASSASEVSFKCGNFYFSTNKKYYCLLIKNVA